MDRRGRRLTQTGRLTLADARALVPLLGTPDRIDPVIGDRVFRTKSSQGLPGLNLLVEWAKAAGLVRAVGGKLVPVKKNTKLLSEPERLRAVLFEAFPKIPSDAVVPSGAWGYRDLRETLADPSAADHEEMLDWLGIEHAAQFDPAAFDVDVANRRTAADWTTCGTRRRG